MILSATNIISGAEIVLKPYLENNSAYSFYLYTSSAKEINDYYTSIEGIDGVVSDQYMTNYLLREHPHKIFNYIWSLMITVKRAHKLIDLYDIQVVYGNNANDLGLLICLKWLLKNRIKVISHIHNQLTSKSVSGIYVKLFGKMIDIYLVPSEATKASLLALLDESASIEVVYNSVAITSTALKEHKSKDHKKVRIGFVGGLSRRKRPDLFLEIFKEIQKRMPSCEGVIIGPVVESDLFERVQHYITEEQLNVDVLPPLPYDQMNTLYETLDCLILTSDSDPLPTVLLEGMSKGIVVAARDVDGVTEIIDDDVDGLVFSYDGDVSETAERIVACLTDDAIVQRYVVAAREKVKIKFSSSNKQQLVNRIIEGCTNKVESN